MFFNVLIYCNNIYLAKSVFNMLLQQWGVSWHIKEFQTTSEPPDIFWRTLLQYVMDYDIILIVLLTFDLSFSLLTADIV